MDNIVQTEIVPTEAQRLEAMKPDPGVVDGTVVVNHNGEHELILEDKDDNSVVIGWHKEVVKGSN